MSLQLPFILDVNSVQYKTLEGLAISIKNLSQWETEKENDGHRDFE